MAVVTPAAYVAPAYTVATRVWARGAMVPFPLGVISNHQVTRFPSPVPPPHPSCRCHPLSVTTPQPTIVAAQPTYIQPATVVAAQPTVQTVVAAQPVTQTIVAAQPVTQTIVAAQPVTQTVVAAQPVTYVAAQPTVQTVQTVVAAQPVTYVAAAGSGKAAGLSSLLG